MRIRAVLDTNVLISGIFWRGAPFQILQAWQKQRFRLVISAPILEEYHRVVDEIMKKHRFSVLGNVLELIQLHSEMVEPVSFAKPLCADPADDKFLEAAMAAEVDYLVSGDTDLLRLKSYRQIEIVRPSHFLRSLEE